MTEAPPTLSTLLRAVTEAEDLDTHHLIAGAINLYHEAIRRRGNRGLLLADDISRLFSIVQTLLAAGDIEMGLREMTGVPKRRPGS